MVVYRCLTSSDAHTLSTRSTPLSRVRTNVQHRLGNYSLGSRNQALKSKLVLFFRGSLLDASVFSLNGLQIYQ